MSMGKWQEALDALEGQIVAIAALASEATQEAVRAADLAERAIARAENESFRCLEWLRAAEARAKRGGKAPSVIDTYWIRSGIVNGQWPPKE